MVHRLVAGATPGQWQRCGACPESTADTGDEWSNVLLIHPEGKEHTYNDPDCTEVDIPITVTEKSSIPGFELIIPLTALILLIGSKRRN